MTSKGRPRTFDKEEALEQAMLLFWRNGYRGVSLDDLTEGMGITRPSLYAAFGDKEELFAQSIEHYLNTVMAPIFRELAEAPQLEPALSQFFKSICKLVTNRENPGCLIACMLSQESCESERIRKRLAELIAGSDRGFVKVLSTHQSELRAGVEIETAAKLLTSLLHGMSTRARAGASERELNVIGAAFIDSLCKKRK